MIYNPLKEYDDRFKQLHLENTERFFGELVRKSKINVEKNRLTVKEYEELCERLSKLGGRINRWRFLRGLTIVCVILIPLAIWKLTPKIRGMRAERDTASQRCEALLAEAHKQMKPLVRLFTDRDAMEIIENTIPGIRFEPSFSKAMESDMATNYDFNPWIEREESNLDVVAGHYNGNPFLFGNTVIHRMGLETYHGSEHISWTEEERDSDGNTHTVHKSQTLHATITRPKPFFSTRVELYYCAQGGPELSFSRRATHLDQMKEKAIERHIKKGERQLKKRTDAAIKRNESFSSMSNVDFEVLFNATDRTNEVQFRTLFTPLAQTNMVSLIRSRDYFGDDFDYIKTKRTNRICTRHSQGRRITLSPMLYRSYAYDEIEKSFIERNTEFFRATYFDLAPILAIPILQERPTHSLKPVPESPQRYSYREYETLANKTAPALFVHPLTKTQAILKARYGGAKDEADKVLVSAFSYDAIPRVEYVSVRGDDDEDHDVPVPWVEYVPLEETRTFYVCAIDRAEGKEIISQSNGLCMFIDKEERKREDECKEEPKAKRKSKDKVKDEKEKNNGKSVG